MLSFRQYLNEVFNTLQAIPVSFGSNEEFFSDGSQDFTDKKFDKFGSNNYRTVFNMEGGVVQVLFDKANNELSFVTGKTADLTRLSFDKQDISMDIRKVFSAILYIIPFLLRQLNPPFIMFSSKEHTKKIYDFIFKNSSLDSELKRLGLEKDKIINQGNSSQYFFKRLK
jgi:hypothetical protein